MATLAAPDQLGEQSLNLGVKGNFICEVPSIVLDGKVCGCLRDQKLDHVKLALRAGEVERRVAIDIPRILADHQLVTE